MPDFSGNRFYTGQSGIWENEFSEKLMGSLWHGYVPFYAPSEDGDYYVSITKSGRELYSSVQRSDEHFGFIHDAKSHVPMAILPDLGDALRLEYGESDHLPHQRRIVFVPAAKSVFVVNKNLLELFMISFDPATATQPIKPYLIPVSSTHFKARQGQFVSGTLKFASSSPLIGFEANRGSSLSINQNGIFSLNADWEKGEVQFQVTVTNDEGVRLPILISVEVEEK